MNNWIETAKQLLSRSLKPIPQELNELDWKSDISDKSERLAQHISAFANNPNGGFLVFGINDDGNIINLNKDKIDEIIKKIGNIARNNLAQPVAIEHDVIEFENKPILIIHIPENFDKPVYLRGKTVYESYKRSAGQTVKLSINEVKHLISISIGTDFEVQTAMHNIDDDEVLRQLDYDSYFSLQEKRFPDTKNSLLHTLSTEDLIKNYNKNWDILNLGAILFCKDIRNFKDLKRKAIRVIVYKETSRINAIKEQEGIKGYASGFEGLISYIMDQLPSNEIIENALRKIVKVYPEVAIREFVANALIHQDFTITGAGIMIEIFSDRLEITNPGIPLVDINSVLNKKIRRN